MSRPVSITSENTTTMGDGVQQPVAQETLLRKKQSARNEKSSPVVASSCCPLEPGTSPQGGGKPRNRAMSQKQKELVSLGLSKGLTDRAIAQQIEGVSKAMVYNLRKVFSISADQVLKNRYDTWIRLIEAGTDVEVVARLYGVKSMSIKQALWHNRGYSFREAKMKLQHIREVQVDASVRKKAAKPFAW